MSERVATFVMGRLAAVDNLSAELIDLRELNLPMMEERLGKIEPTPPNVAELGAKIVGTDPGWDVQVDDPVISNIVRASTEMHYTDSPELENGKTLLVESADDGFDVAITRRVVDDGKVILEDTTRSTFSPSRNLTLRGTGTGTE